MGCLLAISSANRTACGAFHPQRGMMGGAQVCCRLFASCPPCLVARVGGGAGRSKISCVRRQFKELYLGGPAWREIIGRHGFNSHNNFCAGAMKLRGLCAVTAPCKRCRCPIPPIPKRPAHAMHRQSETVRLIIAGCPAC